MKYVVSCVIGVLILSGCSDGRGSPEEQQTRSDGPLVREARAAVVARMRDPDSVKFGDIYSNSKGVVCGSVNAKNGYGGYVGFSAFWYDPKTGEVYLYDPDQNWGGKGYDARLFIQKGCSIGPEEKQALDAARALDASDRRLGIKPFAPEPAE